MKGFLYIPIRNSNQLAFLDVLARVTCSGYFEDEGNLNCS